MRTSNLHILRTLMGLLLGLAILQTGLDRAAGVIPLAPMARAPWQMSLAGQARAAEVAVSFDRRGQIAARVLRRSSGSRASDAKALQAALELAALQRPAAMAGRTLLIRARFGG